MGLHKVKDVLMPKHITRATISEAVNNINFMYDCVEKREPYVSIEFPEMRDMDLLGTLFIYEFMAYSVQNSCFTNPKCVNAEQLTTFVQKYGFKDLILGCFQNSNKLAKAYDNLIEKQTDGLIVQPIPLRPNGKTEASIKTTIALNKVADFYRKFNVPEESLSMIDTIFLELVDNFYSHADDKTNSLIVLSGTKDYVRIACADCGIGLAGSFLDGESNEKKVVSRAFIRGITSKPNSDHMGQGLWIIKETIKLNNGFLFVYSQHTTFSAQKGKELIATAPYWRGTMIDVKINVNKPILISDIVQKL